MRRETIDRAIRWVSAAALTFCGACTLAPAETFGRDCEVGANECGSRYVCDEQLKKCVKPGVKYHLESEGPVVDDTPATSDDTGDTSPTPGSDPTNPDSTGGSASSGCVDVDGDGYGQGCAKGPDCDDTNPQRAPNLQDVCDGIDNNCDGVADADVTVEPLVSHCPCIHTYDSQDMNHAYLLCTSTVVGASRDWTSARAYCQAVSGYDLAITETTYEQENLAGLVSQLGNSHYLDKRAHIGLSDDGARAPGASEVAWRFIDGSTPPGAGWEPGQPNGGAAENCGYLGVAGWGDGACGEALQMWICEPKRFASGTF